MPNPRRNGSNSLRTAKAEHNAGAITEIVLAESLNTVQQSSRLQARKQIVRLNRAQRKTVIQPDIESASYRHRERNLTTSDPGSRYVGQKR